MMMAMGIEVQTRIMLRQEPRKNRIIRDTRAEAAKPSFTTSEMAPRTNRLWSKSNASSRPLGAPALISGSTSLAASTTARVLASAFFRMAR